MGKKKTQRQQDFQKVKLKVGKKLLKSQNETKISVKSRQLVIKEQLKTKSSVESTIQHKRFTVKELLAHLSHHNASVRHDGISSLTDLFLRDATTLPGNASLLVERFAPLFVDNDAQVRRTTRNFLRKVLFVQLPVKSASPFFPLLMAHLSRAMTHIDEGIRRDSLEIVDLCLSFYPSLVVADVGRFLDPFLLQISSRNGSSSTSGNALLVSPSSRASSVQWRTAVFRRLAAVFKALRGSTSTIHEQSAAENGWVVDAEAASGFVGSLLPFSSTTPFRLSDAVHTSADKSSPAAGLDSTAAIRFLRTVTPLLTESWMEAAPLDGIAASNSSKTSRGAGQVERYRHAFDLFAAIVDLLRSFLRYGAAIGNGGDAIASVYRKETLPSLVKCVLGSFPLADPQRRPKDVAVEKASTLNLFLCDVLTFRADLDHDEGQKKRRRPLWAATVSDHLRSFFSKAGDASDEERRLGFDLLRRCASSGFFSDFAEGVVDDVTANFFGLPSRFRLSFLTFLIESMTSPLAGRDPGEFLRSPVVRDWLRKLPGFLKTTVTRLGEMEKGAESKAHQDDDTKVVRPSVAAAFKAIELFGHYWRRCWSVGFSKPWTPSPGGRRWNSSTPWIFPTTLSRDIG